MSQTPDMAALQQRPAQKPFDVLRRFARKRSDAERCELCGLEIPREHEHLVEVANRKLLCACRRCAILFGGQDTARYRRVPRTVRWLQNFEMTDAQWESLSVPINLAFFFHSTPAARVSAFYPSPAGPTESLLPLESWTELAAINPLLGTMEPDVRGAIGQSRWREPQLLPRSNRQMLRACRFDPVEMGGPVGRN